MFILCPFLQADLRSRQNCAQYAATLLTATSMSVDTEQGKKSDRSKKNACVFDICLLHKSSQKVESECKARQPDNKRREATRSFATPRGFRAAIHGEKQGMHVRNVVLLFCLYCFSFARYFYCAQRYGKPVACDASAIALSGLGPVEQLPAQGAQGVGGRDQLSRCSPQIEAVR